MAELNTNHTTGSSRLFLFFLYLLPKNFISRMVGYFAAARLPLFIRRPLFRKFIRAYNVNVEESELPPESYPSLSAFFTRALRPGARPVASGRDLLVSPVDARISEFGDIINGRMIQAKGIDYTMASLLDCPAYAPYFEDGKYMVLYLSPPDYHRIHTPCEGRVLGYSYSPGKLFPVNEVAVRGVPALFPRNERLTSYMETKHGMVALVKVGATNVGKIKVVYDDIVSNRWIRRSRMHMLEQPLEMERAEEIGRFDLGSTVVLLFQRGMVEFNNSVVSGRKVQLGEALGAFAGAEGEPRKKATPLARAGVGSPRAKAGKKSAAKKTGSAKKATKKKTAAKKAKKKK